MPPKKFYVITRSDLPPGVQAVQAAHAALDFAVRHPEMIREWNRLSNYLIFLSVPSEGDLIRLWRQLKEQDIETVAFREPDRGDEMTAVAAEPGYRTGQLLAGLPLALKGVKA